jgi:hypothetical protein
MIKFKFKYKSIKFYAYHLVKKLPFTSFVIMWLRYTFKIRPYLKNQLAPLKSESYQVKEPLIRKRLLLTQIETNHYQFYQMMILGCALELRGAEVKVLLCGSRLDGCEIKSVKNKDDEDPCLVCRFNDKHVVPYFNLDIIRLSELLSNSEIKEIDTLAKKIADDYPVSFIYKEIDIIPIVNDSIIRYFYGDVPIENTELLRQLRIRHLVSSMISTDAAVKLDIYFSPDILLSNMFVYSVAEPYFKYFERKEGVSTSTVTLTPVDYNSVILNIMEYYKGKNRFQKYLDSRGGTSLSPTEWEELDRCFKNRKSGNVPMFTNNGYFRGKVDLKNLLNIDVKNRNIFLFSNVYWDIATGETGQFNTVITWIFETIEILKDRPGFHLFIKIHPAEKLDSSPSLKGVADFVSERFPILPFNVTLITPDMRIKPYDLFPYIDLGAVYSGTLGLEMLLEGIPVVISGKAPYGGLGFAYEPESLEEFTQILLGEIPKINLKKEAVQLFAYFYLVRGRIPWNLTSQAFGYDFAGFSFNSLTELLPGKNPVLDHLCNCILDPASNVIEAYP